MSSVSILKSLFSLALRDIDIPFIFRINVTSAAASEMMIYSVPNMKLSNFI